MQVLDDHLDLEDFFQTYENWQEEILNYFDERQTSATVEGINNKARVITKDLVLNYFPILYRLGQGAVVPFGKEVVEEDFHARFEARDVLAAGRVDPLQ